MKLLFAAVAATVALAQDWNYDTKDEVNGPEAWVNNFPECGRNRQSPINMKGKYTTYKKNEALPNFLWTGLPEEKVINAFTITNTGTTLEITSNAFEGITISEGSMQKEYELSKIQVRWGRSEHEVAGDKQEGELQFIFEDADPEGNEGRLHMAVLIDRKSKTNKDLSPLFDGAALVTTAGTATDVALDLHELLPKNFHKDYWTYSGSLTHPPCTQNVQWVVCRNKLQASRSQLRALEALQDAAGNAMEDNYRPIQKLYSRQIFKSFKGKVKGTSNKDSNKIDLFESLLNGETPSLASFLG